MFWYFFVPLIGLVMPLASILFAGALFFGKVSQNSRSLLLALFAASFFITSFAANLGINSVITVALPGDAGVGQAFVAAILGVLAGIGLTVLCFILLIQRRRFVWILIAVTSCVALITISTFYYQKMINTLRYEFTI